jgi:glycosyltransferase involved in cell wall biosynthesis
MSPKIACLLTSPKYFGGAETALMFTVDGLREIGCDVTVIASSATNGKGWTQQSLDVVDRITSPRKESLEDVLSAENFDGIVLSNVFFPDESMAQVFYESDTIAPWTSGWHNNIVLNNISVDKIKSAPKWCGSFLAFWPTVKDAIDIDSWVESILPYRSNPALTSINRDKLSPEYDFGFIGRADPKKGVLTFVAAMEWASRHADDQSFTALIAGAPSDVAGGPHIWHISRFMENLDWEITRHGPKMKSNWTAVHPKTGSRVDYTGPYNYSDLPRLFSNIKCVVNFTSDRCANSHLEYSALEALEAGCVLSARADWPDYHYPTAPAIFGTPIAAHRVMSKNRIIYNSFKPENIDTVYAEAGAHFAGLVPKIRAIDVQGSSRDKYLLSVARNRQVVADAHDPKIAAKAYLTSLGLELNQ